MSQRVVSVVIPAYNAEKTIETCLHCVMAQNWRALEIIVVDDGSSDGTLALAQQIAADDPRVQVYSIPNSGVSAARNEALSRCTGEYVRFVDADDRLPPDSIAMMVHRMEATGCDLIIGGYTERIGKMKFKRNLEKRNDTVPLEFLLSRLNLKSNSFFYGVLWNKLFRRSLIEDQKVRFTGGLNWGEDFVFVCDYCAGVRTVSYMKEEVYTYVRNTTGLVMQQFYSCIRHPLQNIRMKFVLYHALKRLFVRCGKYDEYRRTLWAYLIRMTINE